MKWMEKRGYEIQFLAIKLIESSDKSVLMNLSIFFYV